MAVIRHFVLAHAEARQRAAQFMREAPAGVSVVISEPTRNSAINGALHAKLAEIARSREWAGQRQTVDTWKRLFVAAWSRATGRALTMLPALDGAGVDIVWRHTSSMSQREVSELLTFIECWEAETAPATEDNE